MPTLPLTAVFGMLVATAVLLVQVTPAAAQGIRVVVENGQQTIRIDEEELERRIAGATFSVSRDGANEQLERELETARKIPELTEADLQKLRVAGQVDVDRFFEDVNRFVVQSMAAHAERRQVVGTTTSRQWEIPANDFIVLVRNADSFRNRLRDGLHGRGSLFTKTLLSLLDDDEIRAFHAARKQQQRGSYRESVDGAVRLVDYYVGITRAQQSQLCELILATMELPEADGPEARQPYVILSKMAEITDEDLEAIFSEKQMPGVRHLIQEGVMKAAEMDRRQRRLNARRVLR